jgi:hypothetical protein
VKDLPGFYSLVSIPVRSGRVVRRVTSEQADFLFGTSLYTRRRKEGRDLRGIRIGAGRKQGRRRFGRGGCEVE